MFKKSFISLCIFLCFILTSCGMREVTSTVENDSFFVDITFEGGTGKAYIKSPVEVFQTDGKLQARFIWSSKNYDYMIVDGVRYDNENEGGESTFTVPIKSVTGTLSVIGDTVAMSTPHEIEYLITWGEKKEADGEDQDSSGEGATDREAVRSALEKAGFKKTEDIVLKYASGLTMEKYGDYSYFSIDNSGDYLIVPKGGTVPEGLPEETVILQKPLDKTYLVSSSAMDLINTCGALDRIALSGVKESDWYIDDAAAAMARGDILYAGKYRAPDYELILQSGCDLAIENTMIYHEPAVKEKLEELGIPVLVEASSYEEHPLGRLEWIKLYGLIFDKEKEAEKYFEDQLDIIEPILKDNRNTGKTVAFFHVTANGLINVRKTGDYISKMIELAGGNYILTGAGDGDNALSTMNMQMEEFYAEASGADIIIYNSTIGGEIGSIDELVEKSSLFSDFKAVKEGNVYCTQRNLFQQITGMADFIKDLNALFNDTQREYKYLNKLD